MPVEDTASSPPAAAVAADTSAGGPLAAEADVAEHQCRFCLETGRVVASTSATAAATTADVGDDDALVAPCRCEGSQRFVHLSCLRRWQHTLVVDKVPMAERGGIARMLAHLIAPAGAGAGAGGGRGGGGGGRTDADCYGDARSAVCQVCRAPFTIPPPTRYDLLRQRVGGDAAGLIRAGGMLVKSQERSERMQTLLESNAPLVPPRRAEAEAAARAAAAAAIPQEAEAEAEAASAPSDDEEEEEDASSEDNDAAAASAAAAPAPGEGDPQRARTAAAIAGVLRMLFETRVGHWTKAAYLMLWVGEEDDVGPATRQPEGEEEEEEGNDRSKQTAEGDGESGGDALAGVAAVQRRKAEKALRTKVVGVNLCRFESEGPVVKIREAAKEAASNEEEDESARRVVGRLRIRKFTGGPVEPSVHIGLCRLRGGAPGSQRAALLAPEKLWKAGLRTLPDALGSVALCGELSVLCDVLKGVLSTAPLVPEGAVEEREVASAVTVTPPPAVEEVAVNAYAGRAVWNETQLLGEMSRGDWGVTQALPGDLWPPQEVPGAGAETVWERIQRDEGRLSAVHWPKKPAKNGGGDGGEE